jgi:hypothetical protein
LSDATIEWQDEAVATATNRRPLAKLPKAAKLIALGIDRDLDQ